MQPHSTRRIYEGRVINLRVDEIDKPSGGRRLIEIVEHNGGAVIIALPSPNEIVLVRQYRYAAGSDLWELPAGMIDPGETPGVAAARELHEETGYTAGRIRYLWAAYSTPGFCQELLHFYVAEDLTPGEQKQDEVEQIEVRTWRLEDAWNLVEADQLRDAKTQIGLLWALRQQR
jgi:ADP-ribose pyrophosphatase